MSSGACMFKQGRSRLALEGVEMVAAGRGRVGGRVGPPLGELLERETRLHALVGHVRQCTVAVASGESTGRVRAASGGEASSRGEA